jgi:DNA-directed RNA polymerase sigma subunit (sigma70/sigma32)
MIKKRNKRTSDDYLDAYKMKESGKTLREIGVKYNVCRERARIMATRGCRIMEWKNELKRGRDYEFVWCYLVVQ